MRLKTRVVAGILAVFLTISGAASAQVHHDRCEQRIHMAEVNLRKAVRKHGERSKQALRRREELQRVRRECGRDHDNR